MTGPQHINYVTSSPYKREENAEFVECMRLSDGTAVSALFTFDIRELPIPELLEIDIGAMVKGEAIKAYSLIRVPCVVEHAGLIFDDFRDKSYPGGLTKPMWNALGPHFVEATGSAMRRVTARAVVAYCDGITVTTFVGETPGTIAPEPRGKRDFYWDSVFIPSEADGAAAGLTYAQIVEDPSLGIRYKVQRLSQSSRAMLKLLEHLRVTGTSPLWD